MSSNQTLQKMTWIKKNWIYGLFIFAVVLFIVTRFKSKTPHPELVKISLKTFRTDMGWGYDIYKDDSIYVHQEFIPAVEGRKGFVSKADAEKIGNLAIEKMTKRKQTLPEILLSDLDSCKITR